MLNFKSVFKRWVQVLAVLGIPASSLGAATLSGTYLGEIDDNQIRGSIVFSATVDEKKKEVIYTDLRWIQSGSGRSARNNRAQVICKGSYSEISEMRLVASGLKCLSSTGDLVPELSCDLKSLDVLSSGKTRAVTISSSHLEVGRVYSAKVLKYVRHVIRKDDLINKEKLRFRFLSMSPRTDRMVTSDLELTFSEESGKCSVEGFFEGRDGSAGDGEGKFGIIKKVHPQGVFKFIGNNFILSTEDDAGQKATVELDLSKILGADLLEYASSLDIYGMVPSKGAAIETQFSIPVSINGKKVKTIGLSYLYIDQLWSVRHLIKAGER